MVVVETVVVGVRVVVGLVDVVAGLVVLCEVVVGGTVAVVVKTPVVTVGPVAVGPDALLVVVTGTVVVVGGTVVTVVVVGATVVPELQIPLVTPTRFPVTRLICVISAPTPPGALARAPQVHPVVYLLLHVPASTAKQLEYVIVSYVSENGFPPRPFEEAPHKMRSPSNVLPAGPDPIGLKNMQLSIGVIKKDDVRTATLLTPP
jgi:hypothetical protein